MKNFVKNIQSLILFDAPLQPAFIRNQFENVHSASEKQLPGWSTNATRQKLIYRYWFHDVFAHYSLIFGLPALICVLFIKWKDPAMIATMLFFTSLLSFLSLYLFQYRPSYSAVFLPNLETIKEAYDRRQTEYGGKCRKAQLSNFALALVFYALDTTCKLNSLQCNDQFAKTLAKLYGVDPGSLKKSLSLILGKNQSISMRKSTEIRNQFEEAYSFLDSINFSDGVGHLRRLEQKILKGDQSQAVSFASAMN